MQCVYVLSRASYYATLLCLLFCTDGGRGEGLPVNVPPDAFTHFVGTDLVPAEIRTQDHALIIRDSLLCAIQALFPHLTGRP